MLDLIVELMTDIDVSDQAHMMTILTKLKI